jgi:CRP/FNR family cyclic AMP-dependent transcriptional regulator
MPQPEGLLEGCMKRRRRQEGTAPQRKLTGAKRKRPAKTRSRAAAAPQGKRDRRTPELAKPAEPPRPTSDVLQVVSSSSSDLNPLEALLANATRLCEAEFGNVNLREGDSFRIAASHGASAAYLEWRGRQPVIRLNELPTTTLDRVASTKTVQHVPDLTKDPAYIERAPPMVALVESVGARSLLSVPLLKDGNVIGAIVLYRQEAQPFDEKQIESVKNFASQAVIAIESARLLKELWQGLFANARAVSVAADQIVFSAGDEGDGCYRVEEGLLKATVAEPGGDERILAILGPGSVVGELSMIDGAPRSASVVAIRDSKLSFVSRAAFEAFGRSRPDLYRHLTTLLANRLRDTNDALAATSFLSIKGRVARALLRLAEAFGREVGAGRILIRQKVSQADLAAMAGIARENVNRVLHDWTERSLVSRLAGYYCLENEAAFKREAEA